MGRRWRWSLHLIGLVLLVLVLSRLDLEATVEHVAGADLVLILLSILIGLPFLWLKSERWRVALQWTGSNPPSRATFRLFAMGQLAGMATPGQIGDLIKVLDLKRHGGTVKSGVIASVGDRALDLAVLTGVSAYYGALYWLAWPALNSIVALVAFTAAIALASAWLWLVASRVMVNWRSGLRQPLGYLREASHEIPWTPILLLAASTVLAYTLYGARLYLLLLAVAQSAPVVAFVSSMAVMSLVALLPISFAGIGTRDAALIVLFQAFDMSREIAVSFSFLVLTLYIFSALVGALAWWVGFSGRRESLSN